MLEELLVSIAYKGGVAGVFREEGDGLWLSANVAEGGSTGIDRYRPGKEGLADGFVVAGGAMPPGASGCELIERGGGKRAAECSDEAWVVVMRDPLFRPVLARFHDDAGETVARPYPAELARSPVEDAPEPCPVCQSSAWEQLEATPTVHWSSYAADEEFDPERPDKIVACGHCGHSIGMPAIVSFADGGEIAQINRDAFRREWEEHYAAGHRSVISQVESSGLQLYRVAGRPAFLMGWTGGSAVTLVDSRNTEVSVESMVPEEADPLDEGEVEVVRESYKDLLMNHRMENWPDRSGGGFAVWMDADDRRVDELAYAARIELRLIPVDGERVEWLVGKGADEWVAVRQHGSTVIKLQGVGIPIEGLELISVSDPATETDPPPVPDW